MIEMGQRNVATDPFADIARRTSSMIRAALPGSKRAQNASTPADRLFGRRRGQDDAPNGCQLTPKGLRQFACRGLGDGIYRIIGFF